MTRRSWFSSKRRNRSGSSSPGRFSRRLAVERLESRDLLAVVPSGFTESQIAAGLTSPTSIVAAPDGRLFVAQQNGTIRVVRNDAMVSQPFATLSVDSNGERGLTGITLDPNFATNGFVYVYYTATSPSSHNRLSRLTAQGDRMLAGSEVVLMDLPALSTVGNPVWHMGGAIHISPTDGKMYVSVGQHQNTGTPQSLSSPFGKILRVNLDGSIPTDNPFYAMTTGINRSIWAIGLRNAFTTAFQPETGLFYINDVGESGWEEINRGIAGANYGWPTTEGNFNPNQFPNYTPPVYTYSHSAGCAVVGGVFYPQTSVQFPSQYAGKYFFQDFCSGMMKYFDPANPSVVSTFATGIDFPVDLTVDAAGSMYYLSRGDPTGGQAPGQGALFKISYAANLVPSINDQPDNTLVSLGFPATFTAGATGSAPLAYQWQRSEAGSGVWTNIANATSTTLVLPSTTLADNGDLFRLRVTNSFGTAFSNPATLSVTTNLPPVPMITLPIVGAHYNGGQTFTYAGTATDNEDGTLPASAYTWQIDFHHDTHSHPFLPATSGSTTGNFTTSNSGHTESNVWYRIHLTVRDSTGLTATTFRDVLPNTANLTFTTNVAGIQLTLDGQPINTPHTVLGVAGVLRTIAAPTTATVGGQNYQFVSWSDGGAQSHTITTPGVNTTYTATYAQSATTYLSDLPFVGTPVNGWGPVERDRSNGEQGAADGNPLRIRGTTYTKGLGVHSTSQVRFNLGGAYTTFLADVGIDDETGGAGSVVFQVLADGVQIYDSGTILGTTAVRSINLNVTGVQQLQLNVNPSTNGNTYDHADWANARLVSTPTTPQPPTAPSGLTATAVSATEIRLNWIDNASTETGFEIDRSANGTTGWTQIGTASTNATTFNNTGLTAATTYFYRVRAVNAAGPSANSGVANATTLTVPATAPTAPSGLTATAISPTEIRLNWTDNASTETGFEIDRSANGTTGWTQVGTVGPNVTTFNNTGLTASTTYFYRVRAVNAAGPSANSGTANATTLAQPTTTYLSDLPFVGTPVNGWGPVERDRSNGEQGATDGNPLRIRSSTYTKGLGVHSTSQVRFNLGGAYTTFLSDIGIDNETGGAGSVVFQVLADGVQIYDSGTILGTTAVRSISLNVTGVQQLQLNVNPTSDGANYDHADWANARLTSSPPTAPPTAPSGLSAAALSPTEIRLDWTDNAATESGFEIDRSANGTTGWTQIGTVGSNVTTFNNTGLSASTTYFYRVRAVNAAGPSANSGSASATTPAQSATTYLSDLPFVGTPVNGWGPVERDRSNGEQGATDGNPLRIRGTTYTKGLGVHSTSQVRFNLGGAYTTFLADVGIDDETGGAGSVVFQVLADGVQIYDSGTILGTTAVRSINLNVTGVQQLQLNVNPSTNGNTYDHADWANARLLAAQQSLSLQSAPLAVQTTSTTSSGARSSATLASPISTMQPAAQSAAKTMNLLALNQSSQSPPSSTIDSTSSETSARSQMSDELLTILASDVTKSFELGAGENIQPGTKQKK